MLYRYKVTLAGIKGFFRVYEMDGDTTLYDFHKQMRADMDFPQDQLIMFKGLDSAGGVVRYFGGIKLGIPGLIRAYKTSTADALDNAGTVEKIAGEWYRIRFGYLSMNQVMKAVKDMELPQKAQEFGEDCSMQCRVRLSLQEDFLKRMGDIEGCEVERI